MCGHWSWHVGVPVPPRYTALTTRRSSAGCPTPKVGHSHRVRILPEVILTPESPETFLFFQHKSKTTALEELCLRPMLTNTVYHSDQEQEDCPWEGPVLGPYILGSSDVTTPGRPRIPRQQDYMSQGDRTTRRKSLVIGLSEE